MLIRRGTTIRVASTPFVFLVLQKYIFFNINKHEDNFFGANCVSQLVTRIRVVETRQRHVSTNFTHSKNMYLGKRKKQRFYGQPDC